MVVNTRKSWRALAGAALLLAGLGAPARAENLKQGDMVAIIGDSITEQKLYSVFMEDYLLMCRPALGLRVMQFGWGGETAPGFLNRMANDTLPFKPTVATTCYGMNDGGYSPMDPGKAQRYRDAQRAIVENFRKAGVRFIVVGSPGVVDADTFHRSAEQATMYNKTLAEERDIARKVAEDEGVTFADVFDPMMDVMTKAKAKYGKEYAFAGGDGVHPGPNGHLVMAYAFLKALGCDGNIGTITLDLAAGKADATEGHKVLSVQNGAVEVESTRYPFCFFGDPASPNATRGVIDFFPFNDDLNRFKLVVKGTNAQRLKVTWGNASKEFAAADLAKGINLAAEFLDNPFCGPFQQVEQKVREQQGQETPAIKEAMHGLLAFRRMMPDEKDTLDRLADAMVRKLTASCAISAEAVQPVKHTIKVEAVQ